MLISSSLWMFNFFAIAGICFFKFGWGRYDIRRWKETLLLTHFFQGIIFWGWFQIFQPGFVLPSIFTKGRPGVEARNIVREAPWIKATILVPLQQFCCLFRMDFETFGPEITPKMIFNVQKQKLLLITYISYLEIPTGFHDPFNIMFGQLLPILTIQRKKDPKPSSYLFILWIPFLGRFFGDCSIQWTIKVAVEKAFFY